MILEASRRRAGDGCMIGGIPHKKSCKTAMATLRPRLRDLGISVGKLTPGPLNAITDVPGVAVGHATIIADAPRVLRTGVTVVMPAAAPYYHVFFAGWHSFIVCG